MPRVAYLLYITIHVQLNANKGRYHTRSGALKINPFLFILYRTLCWWFFWNCFLHLIGYFELLGLLANFLPVNFSFSSVIWKIPTTIQSFRIVFNSFFGHFALSSTTCLRLKFPNDKCATFSLTMRVSVRFLYQLL